MPVDPGIPGQGDPSRSQRTGREFPRFSPGDHMAHFYETRDEWLSLMVAWLSGGLRVGEKCVYVLNAGRDWMDARERLAAEGIDIRGALEAGRLEIREGTRDPRDLQAGLDKALAAIPASWPRVRMGGDMVWARDRVPSSGTFMAFECGVNAYRDHPVAFLCQYDLTQFPGYVVMDALRTHPRTIIDGVPLATPFHQTADVFLKALPGREAARDVPW